ncbi:hypothetical protein D9M70_507890 [compost metagenome]
MAGGEAARGEHGAAEADDGDTGGVAQQAEQFLVVGAGQAQLRQAGRHRAEQRHTLVVELQRDGGDRGQHHPHQRHRQPWPAPGQHDHQQQGRGPQGQGRQVGVGEVADHRQQAGDKAAGLGLVAQQLAQLAGQQAEADTVEIADQDRPRQEAGDESGAYEAGEDRQQADHHRDYHRQVHQPLRITGRQWGDGRSHHGRGGGIGPDHELPGAADQGVDEHRQDAGIEPDLGRKTDDLGVGDGGGNLHGGHRQAGGEVGAQPFSLVMEAADAIMQPLGQVHRNRP